MRPWVRITVVVILLVRADTYSSYMPGTILSTCMYPPNSPVRLVLLLTPFCQWGKWGIKSTSDLPKASHTASKRWRLGSNPDSPILESTPWTTMLCCFSFEQRLPSFPPYGGQVLHSGTWAYAAKACSVNHPTRWGKVMQHSWDHKMNRRLG